MFFFWNYHYHCHHGKVTSKERQPIYEVPTLIIAIYDNIPAFLVLLAPMCFKY